MNKFLHHKLKRGISFVLLLIMGMLEPLSLAAFASPAIHTDDAVHISTVQDLTEFSANCTSDVWSQDKLFVLDNDIDLSGVDFTPIPTFGGIFSGQGHTIKGLSLTGGSDHIGLFRYIQESGEVYSLSVSGSAAADSSHSGLGLLTGCNYGLISGCHAQGNVTGDNQAAGIAGINEVTGVITDCTVNGTIYGNHLSGGVAGSNKGSILNCVNHSFINTTASENKIDLSSIDVDTALTDLLTTENAASVTDIGGIAGSNCGIIRACVNDGSVGYQHVGYNIGGIAGSQTGYIEGCVNYGLLNGRKDVGGIAGQMEPSSELEFSEDTLKKLDAEFDKLHDLFTQLDRDASDSSGSLTGQVDRLLTSVENAQHAVDEIINNAGSDMAEFSRLTDLTSLPSPRPISLDFLDELPTPSFTPWPSGSPDATPDGLPSATPETPSASPAGTPAATPSKTPDVPVSTLSDGTALSGGAALTGDNAATLSGGAALSDVNAALSGGAALPDDAALSDSAAETADTDSEGSDDSSITTSRADHCHPMAADKEYGSFIPAPLLAAPDRVQVLPLDEAPASGDAAEAAPAATADAAEMLPTPSAADTTSEGVPSPSATPSHDPFHAGWPEGWPTPSSGLNLDSLAGNIDREKVEKNLNEVQDNVYQDASQVLEGMYDTLKSRASIASSRIYSAQNSLSGSFSAILSDMRILNSMLDEENQILLDDFQAIIDEINVISNIITNPQTTDPDDILTDISDEDQLTDTTGKVMNCTNNGKINGDLNVGGIAGSLSRENNLDPEDDLDLDKYDVTLNFRYKERIVIRKCQNTGFVEGKKDCIGGIAGEMVLGSIIDCINSGDISSDGDKLGGIAGYCASTIRSSSAKCSLNGNSQIGGIAGYGTSISDCFSMVDIRDGKNYLGSVAGKTDSASTLEHNYFVQGCPAGVDGISYDGQAQPLSYEAFMEMPELPDIFRNIYLIFTADDKTVSTITLEYGDTFDPAALPPVPKKEGYIGKWSSFDTASITFDQRIEAIYTEYVSTLESDRREGERPVLLIEGCFDPEDSFTLSGINAYPEDAKTKSECWKVSLSSASSGPYTIRYLIPADMENPRIELYEDSTWHPIDTEKDGSYYVFTSEKADIIFSCVDRPASLTPGTIITLIICAVLLIGMVLIIIRAKKKRNLM